MFMQKEDIPIEDVFEAYYSCRKNKRRTANALRFEADYETNCVALWREINERTYEIGRSITFVVTKPKKREVFAADFRDRVVHHLVASRLEPLFESVFIEDNYNCRKNKGVLYGLQRLHRKIRDTTDNYTRNDCYIGKFDMQGFFMSIHKPTLWMKLERFIKEKYHGADKSLVLWLTEKIVLHNPELNCVRKSPLKAWDNISADKSLFTCGSDYGLPIGNLTSQMFANFYLHEFDIEMEGMFLGYGRYVDDFYVLARRPEDILEKIGWMKAWLKDNCGVRLHPNKFYLQHYSKGCKFLGSVIKMDRMYAGSYTTGRMENRIRWLNTKDPMDADCRDKFRQSINSYMGFLKHYSSYAIRRRMGNIISKDWWSVIYVSGRFLKINIRKKYKSSFSLRGIEVQV